MALSFAEAVPASGMFASIYQREYVSMSRSDKEALSYMPSNFDFTDEEWQAPFLDYRSLDARNLVT